MSLPSHSSRATWTHHCSVVCHCHPTAAEQHGHITEQWCAIAIPQQQSSMDTSLNSGGVPFPSHSSSSMDTSLFKGVPLPSHSSRATWTHHCSVVCHCHQSHSSRAAWTHHCSVVCHFHPTAAEQHGHITEQWCAIAIPQQQQHGHITEQWCVIAFPQQQSNMDTSLNSGVPLPSHSSRATWTHHCSVVCHFHPTAAEQHGHITEQWCAIAIPQQQQHGHITEQWCVIAFPQQQSSMDTSLNSGVPFPSHSSRATWTHHCPVVVCHFHPTAAATWTHHCSVVCHCHPTAAAEQHGHITVQWCAIAIPQQQSNMDTSLFSGVPFPSHSSSNMDTSLFSGVPFPSHSSRATWTHHCPVVVCHFHPTAAEQHGHITVQWWCAIAIPQQQQHGHITVQWCAISIPQQQQYGHITVQWCAISIPQQQSSMDTSLNSGGVPLPSHSSSNMDTSLNSGVSLPSHSSRATWTHHCSVVCHFHPTAAATWTHH